MSDPSPSANGEPITPGRILQVGMGFWASKTLLSAVGMGLFTLLAENPLPAREIQKELGLADRSLFDFLDALVALGFLEREGLKQEAIYRNAPDADRFLDRKKPTYVGGMLEMANDRLYPFWGDLEEGLRTGKPQNEIKGEDEDLFFEKLVEDEDRLRQFVRAMAGTQMGNFEALIEQFDFSEYDLVCDVGGASGAFAVQLARAYDGVDCITFDLPPVEPIAREHVHEAGLEGRIEVMSRDFFEEPLPQADVHTMGNILHDWNLEEKKELIEKSHESLGDGGALIVIENVIDDERRENEFGLLMSLNMLIETPGGFDFTMREFDRWTTEAGFSETERLELGGPASAAIAYK